MAHPHCLAGLRAFRIARNIPPKDIAKRIGVDLHTYYRYESGARRIQFDRVCVIADMLGCTVDELRYDPDLPAPPPAIYTTAHDTVDDSVATAALLSQGWEP